MLAEINEFNHMSLYFFQIIYNKPAAVEDQWTDSHWFPFHEKVISNFFSPSKVRPISFLAAYCCGFANGWQNIRDAFPDVHAFIISIYEYFKTVYINVHLCMFTLCACQQLAENRSFSNYSKMFSLVIPHNISLFFLNEEWIYFSAIE